MSMFYKYVERMCSRMRKLNTFISRSICYWWNMHAILESIYQFLNNLKPQNVFYHIKFSIANTSMQINEAKNYLRNSNSLIQNVFQHFETSPKMYNDLCPLKTSITSESSFSSLTLLFRQCYQIKRKKKMLFLLIFFFSKLIDCPNFYDSRFHCSITVSKTSSWNVSSFLPRLNQNSVVLSLLFHRRLQFYL